MNYRTVMGDTADSICHKKYGQASGYVEKLYELNYRMSVYPIEFPAGIEIELPEKAENEIPQTQNLINLWD